MVRENVIPCAVRRSPPTDDEEAFSSHWRHKPQPWLTRPPRLGPPQLGWGTLGSAISPAHPMSALTSVLFGVDDLCNTIAARRLSAEELKQQQSGERRNPRRRGGATGAAARSRAAGQRHSSRQRTYMSNTGPRLTVTGGLAGASSGETRSFAPAPWNDQQQMGRRTTKGNASAGSWIPPWSYVAQVRWRPRSRRSSLVCRLVCCSSRRSSLVARLSSRRSSVVSRRREPCCCCALPPRQIECNS